MAIANRYTQSQPLTYTPRTLQELMIAPAYMRGQHDEMNENIALSETALAKVKNEEFMNPIVEAEQNRLYADLQAQSDALNSEGFNNSSKSKFLRFNKDYQQSIGPKGIIGKAQEYSEDYLKQREAAIANAVNSGHDPSKTTEQLDNQYREWADSFDGNKLTPFKVRNAPKYEDLMVDLKDIKSIAGKTVSTSKGQEGYNVIPDATSGMYVAVTNSGQIITGSNDSQLGHALSQLNDKWLTEQGAGYQSDKWNMIDPEYRRKQINESMGIMKDSSYQDTRQKHYQFMNPPSNSVTDRGIGLTIASEQYTPVKYTGMSYTEISDNYNNLKSKGALSPTEQIEYDELDKFMGHIESELSENPEYIKNKELRSRLEQDLETITNGQILDSDKAIYPNPTDQQINSYRQSKTLGINKRIGEINDKINDLSKETIEFNQLKMTSYTLTPRTPKQESLIKVANNTIGMLLRNNPQSLSNIGVIKEVIKDGKPHSINTNTDKEGISNLFYESKPGQIEVIDYSPEGLSGYPEYTLRLTPSEGSKKYDLDGIGGGRGNIGGSPNDPVQVRVSFNKTGNGAANNMNGYMQEYVAESGPDGAKLVESMNISKAFMNYRGYTWGELEEQGIVNNDRTLLLIKAQKLIEMGATSASTDEELNILQDKLKDKKIRKYE